MTKYIDANCIYAAWMIRNQTMAITNQTLAYINREFLEQLHTKGDFHFLNLGDYDKEYFNKNNIGLICKESISIASLMSLINRIDMDTYLLISETIEKCDLDENTLVFKKFKDKISALKKKNAQKNDKPSVFTVKENALTEEFLKDCMDTHEKFTPKENTQEDLDVL